MSWCETSFQNKNSLHGKTGLGSLPEPNQFNLCHLYLEARHSHCMFYDCFHADFLDCNQEVRLYYGITWRLWSLTIPSMSFIHFDLLLILLGIICVKYTTHLTLLLQSECKRLVKASNQPFFLNLSSLWWCPWIKGCPYMGQNELMLVCRWSICQVSISVVIFFS